MGLDGKEIGKIIWSVRSFTGNPIADARLFDLHIKLRLRYPNFAQRPRIRASCLRVWREKVGRDSSRWTATIWRLWQEPCL